MIVQNLLDEKETLSVMTLDPALEHLLHNVLQQQSQNQNVVMEPGLAERLFGALRQGSKEVEEQGQAAVLVVSPAIRPWLAKAVRHRVSELVVLSYAEIPDDQSIQVIHTVNAETQQA
jgi:flagellar biosynthesis protein FlhA